MGYIVVSVMSGFVESCSDFSTLDFILSKMRCY